MSFLSDIGSAISSAASFVSSAALNVATMAFPPLAIANSAANLLQGAVGQAIGGALQQLCQTAGMPKFIAQEVQNLVKGVLDQLGKPSEPECDHHVKGQMGDTLKDLIKGIMDNIVKTATEEMEGGGKGKKGAGSWYEALAKALGQALDKQAAKIEELSDKVQGMGDSKESDKASVMTDLQAASQKMSFMMNAANDVLKTIGQALGTMASKN